MYILDHIITSIHHHNHHHTSPFTIKTFIIFIPIVVHLHTVTSTTTIPTTITTVLPQSHRSPTYHHHSLTINHYHRRTATIHSPPLTITVVSTVTDLRPPSPPLVSFVFFRKPTSRYVFILFYYVRV